MIKVLHFNYDPEYVGNYILDLIEAVSRHKDITFESIVPQSRNYDWVAKDIEKELKDKDILLIHPGVNRQVYVMQVLPKKFPELKIGILTFIPKDYHEREGNVAVLPITIDYSFSKGIDNMIEFILAGRQGSGGD